MQSFPAQKAGQCAACCIVVFALGAGPKALPFRQPVLPVQSQAPHPHGGACVPAAALFHVPATPDDPFFPSFIAPGALLIPPLGQEPSFPLIATAPLVSAPEDTEQAVEAPSVEQKAPEADQAPQDTRVAGLLQSHKEQEQRLFEHDRAIEKLVSTQQQLANTLSAFQKDAEKKLSRTVSVKTIVLTLSGICLLVTLSAFLFQGFPQRPSRPVPVSKIVVKIPPHTPPPPQSHTPNALTRVEIAACSLSAPKQEDVILTDFAPYRYTLVLADGASSYRSSGGEISGGGRQAAEITAHTALTHIRRYLHPPLCLDGMLTVLNDCFAAANAALERHNSHTATPGGTTLLIAMLCQAGDGRWYWLSGNVGNGVLSLVHATPLLAGWPIHTPLLSKQANGVTTITLPGNVALGYPPAVGVRPHRPGDMLLIGSDGLDHLDTLTKKCDRLSFPNYLWKKIQSERDSLSMGLKALQQGRTDAAWQNALALDDTTIGILRGGEAPHDRNN